MNDSSLSAPKGFEPAGAGVDRGQELFQELEKLRAELAASRDDARVTEAELATARDELASLQKQREDLTNSLQGLKADLLRKSTFLTERHQLNEQIVGAIASTKQRLAMLSRPRASMTPEAAAVSAGSAEWDALFDTRYAHQIPGFEKILQLFHQEWYGIRAAAGYLPGRKLAVSADTPMSLDAVRSIVESILAAAPDKIVIHGMSDNTALIADALVRLGFSDQLYMVFHGATSQWEAGPERRFAFLCLDFAATGRLRKLHMMKPGFDFPLNNLFRPMLFNLSPMLSPDQIGAATFLQANNRAVFTPGWDNWRKNIYTNVLGAALSAKVDEVWLHASSVELPKPAGEKLRKIPFKTREQTFQLMSLSAMTLNVSLVDCHPMANIEAQTLGRPCLRGPLFLDALDGHSYIKLTTVEDVTSAVGVRDGIDRVLDVESSELRSMIADYQKQSDLVAIDRYREFLEI